MPSYADALELMHQHTPNDSLRRHMYAVEAGLRWYANKLGQNAVQWGTAGLLHDFDYEQHPNEHPLWGMAKLEELGYDNEVIQAIAAHYPGKTGKQPESLLERYLYACDELAGLITAVTYVRPSKSIMDLEVKSVLKKFKETSFAAGVNRDDVRLGCELIDLPIEEHVSNMILAMRADAERIGLAGI